VLLVDRNPKLPGDPGVLLALGGGQHDSGPQDLALLGRRTLACSTRRWLAVSATANGLGRLTCD
jgi:hypothetical protein